MLDTLIVWTDPEGVDMALSFQEADGCGIVWLAAAAASLHSDVLTPVSGTQ